MDRNLRNLARVASDEGTPQSLAALGAAYLRSIGRPEGEIEPEPKTPQEEYREEISSLVDDIMEQIGADGNIDTRDQLDTYIWETIDSHQFVIYTSKAQEVVSLSNNADYTAENWGPESLMRDGDVHWSGIAFGAMLGDVRDELDRRGVDLNEPFTCDECGSLHEYRGDADECCDEEEDEDE